MTDPSDPCIFHICSREAAVAARLSGEYRAPSLDSEGFIHLSQAHQVRGVLDAFYAGQPDLVLLVVDPGLVTSPLRREPPGAMPSAATLAQIPTDQLFPHIYGPLNTDAILDVLDVARFHGQAVHADTAALLRHYRLERLPVEGTLFKSTWRSDVSAAAGGPAGTAMIGLYAESPESLSCFHRLAHDEVWHVYGGDPFVLYLLHADGHSEEVLMGTSSIAGQRVQFVVPGGVWQAGCLKPGGRYALFGCTMAPGFTGGGFEAGVAAELVRQYPDRAEIILRLAVNGGRLRMPAGFAD
jgi:predicted cupin superfamily sugar epimerase/uncharacterized protein (DUF952 family)